MGTQHGRQNRSLAGHAGLDGPENAGGPGPPARLWHCAPHRADQPGPALHQPRDALSGTAQAGAGRLHLGGVGRVRQQPQSQVLPPDQGGAQAAGVGNTPVAADYRNHRPLFRAAGRGVMRILRRTWKRLTGTCGSPRRERELSAEMEAHLQMQTEDNLARGLSPDEARRQALLKFGGVESAKESYRDQRGLPQLETLAQDTRYAFRAMRKSPGFAAVAIFSLALGIAATTAIFSIVNSTLLRPLPYGDPARLVAISAGGAISAPLYDKFRREARSIEQAALFVNVSLNLAGDGEPERVPAARVSASLFGLLGAKARLGRTFTPEEDQPKGDTVVIIGDGLWKRRFGGDPRVVGRKDYFQGRLQCRADHRRIFFCSQNARHGWRRGRSGWVCHSHDCGWFTRCLRHCPGCHVDAPNQRFPHQPLDGFV